MSDNRPGYGTTPPDRDAVERGGPWWWAVIAYDGEPQVLYCRFDGPDFYITALGPKTRPIREKPTRWLGPVLTPAEADALRAEVAELREEVEELRREARRDGYMMEWWSSAYEGDSSCPEYHAEAYAKRRMREADDAAADGEGA